jgi:hypothetical protein
MARVLVAADRYDRDLCRPNGGLDVPGKPVTDQQVRAYMQDRLRHSQHAAAARAGFSARTARRIENDPRLPSQRRAERGRTVPDPLGEVWEPVLLPILENDPAVQAVTLLRHLQMADPDAFPDDRVRRTLERRVRDWRALHGAARDVIFRQTPEPGRMALSDFTDAAELAITIAGRPFAHRLYHFVLGYSGWEHVGIIQGGESFTALAENLQNALWSLGGVPREHRTDSLSAAYRNLDREAAEDVTQRYDDFCGHYGMVASRNKPGEAHENGTVEAHNRHLKVALDQALILRGSRDFASVADWRGFVDQLVARRNRRREAAVRIEAAALRPLPARRTTDFTEVVARVTRTGGFLAHSVFYSAPSRLIGSACASMSTTTASKPGSAGPASSAIPASARGTTVGASTASTIAMSSMPCAASHRRWPDQSTATASFLGASTLPPGQRCPRCSPGATPAGAWSTSSGSPMTTAARPSWRRFSPTTSRPGACRTRAT